MKHYIMNSIEGSKRRKFPKILALPTTLQARASLEQGIVEDILDENLLRQECNKEMMLKMGQLGLRCVVKVPRQRPTMTQVWQELEEALHSTEAFIHKQPSRGPRKSVEHDDSQSFVSIDGVKLQRFHVEMEGLSFQSTSMRCLEVNSIIGDDIGPHTLVGIGEESDTDSSDRIYGR